MELGQDVFALIIDVSLQGFCGVLELLVNLKCLGVRMVGFRFLTKHVLVAYNFIIACEVGDTLL